MLLAFVTLPLFASAPNDVGWPMHGGIDNIRYSALSEINRTNVNRLQVAWTYDSRDAFKGPRCKAIRRCGPALYVGTDAESRH